jgi:hypothetical protein
MAARRRIAMARHQFLTSIGNPLSIQLESWIMSRMDAFSDQKLGLKPHALRWPLLAVAALLISLATSRPAASAEAIVSPTPVAGEKRVIGPTATVAEAKTDMQFKARVDTGATSSSVHVEEYEIEDAAPEMADNVGKKIRFRITNQVGESEWLESKIAEVTVVKTSVDQQERYKVRLTLRLHEVKKRVLVTLNDRSHMKYPMLLGRNFLKGDFVVDVEGKKSRTASKSSPAEQSQAVQEKSPEPTPDVKREATLVVRAVDKPP